MPRSEEDYDHRMDTVLRVIDRVETWVFRTLAVLVRAITALLARLTRRGRYRPWRRGT